MRASSPIHPCVEPRSATAAHCGMRAPGRCLARRRPRSAPSRLDQTRANLKPRQARPPALSRFSMSTRSRPCSAERRRRWVCRARSTCGS